MNAETAGAVAVALLVGLMAGLAIARLRRRQPAVVAVDGPAADASGFSEDDTRPTLVPFRVAREGGRSQAKVSSGPEETAEERDQLDALLADLDRRAGSRAPPPKKG
jgi:hypothetical protein